MLEKRSPSVGDSTREATTMADGTGREDKASAGAPREAMRGWVNNDE